MQPRGAPRTIQARSSRRTGLVEVAAAPREAGRRRFHQRTQGCRRPPAPGARASRWRRPGRAGPSPWPARCREQPTLRQAGPLVGRGGPHQVGRGVVGPAEPGDPPPETAGVGIGASGLGARRSGERERAPPRRRPAPRPRRRRAGRSRPRRGRRPRRRRLGAPPPGPSRAGPGAGQGHRSPARRCGRAGRRPPTPVRSPPAGGRRGRAATRASGPRCRRPPTAGRRAPRGPARARRSRAARPRRRGCPGPATGSRVGGSVGSLGTRAGSCAAARVAEVTVDP